MNKIKVIPAIDLKDSKCVRLHKGDFNQQTVYSDNPLSVAMSFKQMGSDCIHIVDLDGAKSSVSEHLAIIKEIVIKTGLEVQTGGGIRNRLQLVDLFDSGVNRVIIGSLAVKEIAMVKSWISEFGSDKIVLAFDVNINNGTPYLAINGWQDTSSVSLADILKEYSEAKHILCTDISRDGTLSSPNFDLYRHIKSDYPNILIQASGGVSSIMDITTLKNDGIYGVIVGKALYENKFTLKEALSC